MNTGCYRWIVVLAVLLYGSVAGAGSVRGIPAFEADYTIERGIFDVGHIRLRFQVDPDGNYKYKSVTEVAGFISWFRDDRVMESSHGRLDTSGVVPDRYRFARTGGKGDKQVTVRFDWNSEQVENTVDGQSWAMAVPHGTLDKLVVQLAMMRNLQVDIQNQHFKVADGGKLKDFRIHIRGREALDVPAGHFETIKVEKTPEYGSRKTFLWLAPALGYLPVRIMRIENDGAEYYSVLDSVSESLRSR